MAAGPEIERLIHLLSKLPGLGPRSARRVMLHLIKRRDVLMRPLAAALDSAAQAILTCPVCGNLDTVSPCAICADPSRDGKMICVVEDVADLWAIERSQSHRGRYHVLGGILSALDGVKPEDLNIDSLIARIGEEGTSEVILAMNATVEGQTTAHYLGDRLAETGVRMTRIAHGVPIGGELDYLDEGTLAAALRARRSV